MRWSERQPLSREEGMATSQGTTLNTQPWRGERTLKNKYFQNKTSGLPPQETT